MHHIIALTHTATHRQKHTHLHTHIHTHTHTQTEKTHTHTHTHTHELISDMLLHAPYAAHRRCTEIEHTHRTQTPLHRCKTHRKPNKCTRHCNLAPTQSTKDAHDHTVSHDLPPMTSTMGRTASPWLLLARHSYVPLSSSLTRGMYRDPLGSIECSLGKKGGWNYPSSTQGSIECSLGKKRRVELSI